MKNPETLGIAGIAIVALATASIVLADEPSSNQLPSPDDAEVSIRTNPESAANQALPAAQRPSGKVFSWIQAKNAQITSELSSFPLYRSIEADARALQGASPMTTEPLLQGSYVYQYAQTDSADPASIVWRRTRSTLTEKTGRRSSISRL